MTLNQKLGIFATAGVLILAGCQQNQPGQVSSAEEIGTSQAAASAAPAACTPQGAHTAHIAVTSCNTCHACDGGFGFDPAGPAVVQDPTVPPPAYNPLDGTCSNVACHGVPSGTYGYWQPIDEETSQWVEYAYGGGAAAVTPSWFSAGSGTACTGCHGNPPTPPANNWNTWHSGRHAYTQIADGNSCTLCHPHILSVAVDADPNTAGIQPTPTRTWVATGISTANNCGPNRNESCAARHRNGVLNVEPKWRSACYTCH